MSNKLVTLCICHVMYRLSVHLLSLQVLIGDEPEQGMENLMELEIPEDVEKKLKEADIREQQELESEQERMRKEEEEEKKKNSDSEGKDKGQENEMIP